MPPRRRTPTRASCASGPAHPPSSVLPPLDGGSRHPSMSWVILRVDGLPADCRRGAERRGDEQHLPDERSTPHQAAAWHDELWRAFQTERASEAGELLAQSPTPEALVLR